MKKRLSMFVMIVVILASAITPNAYAAYVNGSYISSQGACVMDYDTGEVYYHHNGNTARVPASMTKIMNMYCIYEALANGEITLDTPVPISSNVYYKSRNSLYQNMIPLNYNTTYTVDEMMDVIVVHSASAAAVAMAELLDGTESAYAARMTRTAQAMGLNAVFYDSCGVADNRMTPISMAILAKNIISKYPDILARSSQKSVYFHGRNYATSNHLLDTFYYEGADGLKTGTGSVAGCCFCGTAQRDGRRMISVTMGSSSTSQRFIDSAKLLDYGFAAAKEKYDSIYFSDMSTFINGMEMPTFGYIGNPTCAVVIAEDLRNYGFDVIWDGSTMTLYLDYNPEKECSPMELDFYKGKNGQKAYGIYTNSVTKVILNDGITEHELENVFNLNGYMALSVDEFKGIYDFVWNGETRSININPIEKNASVQEIQPEITPDENSL